MMSFEDSMEKFIWVGLFCVLVWMPPSGSLSGQELGPEQYAARAVQFAKEGKQAEALADFDKAIQLAPEKPIHYRNRAAFYALTKQSDKAIADYSKDLKLESNDLGTQINRGYAYLQSGQLEPALADFSAVLKTQPDNER